MKVTIELPRQVHDWISQRVESGEAPSISNFIEQRLSRDALEEQLLQADAEPSEPLTSKDWDDLKAGLADHIARKNAASSQEAV
jgi:Arc/MetJ-type ribon-helix-helix transcriptional regulator